MSGGGYWEKTLRSLMFHFFLSSEICQGAAYREGQLRFPMFYFFLSWEVCQKSGYREGPLRSLMFSFFLQRYVRSLDIERDPFTTAQVYVNFASLVHSRCLHEDNGTERQNDLHICKRGDIARNYRLFITNRLKASILWVLVDNLIYHAWDLHTMLIVLIDWRQVYFM